MKKTDPILKSVFMQSETSHCKNPSQSKFKVSADLNQPKCETKCEAVLESSLFGPEL